ncbi:tRNA dihydrouridine synthase [Marinomonas sp. TW1]|uniref:tRNA dihydrouridine synthase n=1 Tax=Marinomonas sp. TW1 TaxID=1561203 RepID=UPI000AC630A2|nr:tRNA-dihydrouridine synthase family protein [Marinomonas sp. TW1]
MNNSLENNQNLHKEPQRSDIILAVAPMEGVMDHTMRALLSKIGGMNYLVSEFVRVTQYPIPTSSFKKLIPENKNSAKTDYHHPVHTQLLGSNAELMAESAVNAIAAGANHIDVNFGCPAKRVNGHGGGSVLLQDSETLFRIMNAIRQQVPAQIPVSAKIRLGYEDEEKLFDNVAAIESAGTNALTIHGRTKKDGYKPPARWEKIGLIQDRTQMRVIANGDITDLDSLTKCKTITGCTEFMIGRGSLNNPFIFQDIRNASYEAGCTQHKTQLALLFVEYTQRLQLEYDEVATLGRLKQWIGHLRFEFSDIQHHLKMLRQSKSVAEFTMKIQNILKA